MSCRTITSGTISEAPGGSQMSTPLCWYQIDNARELDEEVFKPLGAKLHLDTHTGLLQLTPKSDNIMMSSELAKV